MEQFDFLNEVPEAPTAEDMKAMMEAFIGDEEQKSIDNVIATI